MDKPKNMDTYSVEGKETCVELELEKSRECEVCNKKTQQKLFYVYPKMHPAVFMGGGALGGTIITNLFGNKIQQKVKGFYPPKECLLHECQTCSFSEVEIPEYNKFKEIKMKNGCNWAQEFDLDRRIERHFKVILTKDAQ